MSRKIHAPDKANGKGLLIRYSISLKILVKSNLVASAFALEIAHACDKVDQGQMKESHKILKAIILQFSHQWLI